MTTNHPEPSTQQPADVQPAPDQTTSDQAAPEPGPDQSQDLVTVTMIVQSRGRKYFTCLLAGHKALLVINDVTRDLALDRIVTIEAIDHSITSKYGTQMKYEAVRILRDRSAQEARERAALARERLRWMGFAEQDAANGLSHSRAILDCLAWKDLDAERDAELVQRQAALRTQVAANRAAEPLREAAKWLRYAEDDAAQGLTRTNAITRARALAPAFPELASRLEAVNATIAAAQDVAEAAIAGSGSASGSVTAGIQQALLVSAPQLGVVTTLPEWRSRPVVFTRVVGKHRIDEDDPSMWGSHLLGEEGSWGVLVEYRDPTEEELAAHVAAQVGERRAAQERIALQAEKKALQDLIREHGTIPDGPVQLQGDQLCGGPNLYGGGSWFVITDEGIWSVVNNGADGDSWERNNIVTHGAGAVGWRIDPDEQVAERIRTLHHALLADQNH